MKPTLSLLTALLLAPLAAPLMGLEPVRLHVATNGQDQWTGREITPDGENGPFATLGRAQEAVREIIRKDPKGTRPIAVLIHGGTYRLSQPLTFNPADADGRSITWQAAPGERPVLSAAKPVGGWERWKADLWKARTPSGLPTSALWCGDQAYTRARYPKLISGVRIFTGWLFVEHAINPEAGSRDAPSVESFFAAKADLPAWSDWSGVEIVHYFWTDDYLDVSRVKRVESESGRVHVQRPVGSHRSAFKAGNRYFFQNALAALTEPGEYVSAPDGQIYVWPRRAEDLARLTVAHAKHVLTIAGDPGGRPVRGLTFRGLTFTGASEALVRAQGAEGCHFDRCLFVNGSHYGLVFEQPGRDNVVEGCEFAHLGSSGVRLNGQPPGLPDTLVSNTVRNCHFHHTSEVQRREAAICIHAASSNRIEQNLIHDLPNYAVQLIGGLMLKYWTEAGKQPWALKTNAINGVVVTRENVQSFFNGRNNLIARNRIYNTCLEFADTGALYSWAPGAGNVFRENIIVDTVGTRIQGKDRTSFKAMSIYLDDESDHSVVERNIVVGSGCWGIYVHNTAASVVRHNVVIDACMGSLVFDNDDRRPDLRNEVSGNIVLARGWPQLSVAAWPAVPDFARFSGNFYDVGSQPELFQNSHLYDRSAWQELGHDRASRFGDSGLGKLARWDFSFIKDGRGRALGLPEWNTEGIGLLPGWGDGPESDEGKAARLGGPVPISFFTRELLDRLARSRSMPLRTSPKPRAVATYSASLIDPAGGLEAAPAKAVARPLPVMENEKGERIEAQGRLLLAYDRERLHVWIDASCPDPKLIDQDAKSARWGATYAVEFALRLEPGQIAVWRGFASGRGSYVPEAETRPDLIAPLSKATAYTAKVEGDRWVGHWSIARSALGLAPGQPRPFNVGIFNPAKRRTAQWVGSGWRSWWVDVAGLLELAPKE
jgi:parallel beta-helix repeat protein